MASYQAQHIQFENWTCLEVANWLHGLDESVAQYVPLFHVNGVDGRKLLMLNHADLEKIGINKLGHQELVLEAVDLLRSLRYTLDTENLQFMALQVGCKARNLVAEIQLRQGENDQNRANMLRGELQRKRLTITVLSYVADMLATLKSLVSWLDRAPFEGIYDICRMRNSVVKLGLDLVTVTQRESSYVDPEEAIIKACRMLMEYCEGVVRNTRDPLVIQPAALEQATIRKKQGEELGMNIQSAYNGIHGISSIKDLSPADMCSKIEKGDEVLQVNGQTVLGWQLKELVKILKDRPKEVTLLLKKRPRHINPLGAMQNHKKLAAKHAQQAATLPKSLKKRRSREGDAKQPRPSLQEFVSVTPTGDDVYITKDTPDTNDGDGNDTDNDVFRSGSESPQYTLPVMPDAKQRRATVSGGSPTFERNSLMVEDPVIRPKSQAINPAEHDTAMAMLAASESSLRGRMVEGGQEEGAAKEEGTSMPRKTSSENSSGHKGPSESEMEDSVFSSDKEDKEQQRSKKRVVSVKQQEFRVTKPTPMLLEPTAHVDSPPKALLRKTSSSSSSASSSTLINSPPSTSKTRAQDSGPSCSSPAASARNQSPTCRPLPPSGRPPSPHSAPPKRKRSTNASLPRESGQSAGVKSKVACEMGRETNVSEPSVVIRPTPVVAPAFTQTGLAPSSGTARVTKGTGSATAAALEFRADSSLAEHSKSKVAASDGKGGQASKCGKSDFQLLGVERSVGSEKTGASVRVERSVGSEKTGASVRVERSLGSEKTGASVRVERSVGSEKTGASVRVERSLGSEKTGASVRVERSLGSEKTGASVKRPTGADRTDVNVQRPALEDRSNVADEKSTAADKNSVDGERSTGVNKTSADGERSTGVDKTSADGERSTGVDKTSADGERSTGADKTSVDGERSKGVDMTTPLTLEVSRDHQNHHPLSVQQAIHAEVARDTQHRDTPQLIKVKKLHTPKATDAPVSVSELWGHKEKEGGDGVRQKKRVEFSPDSKESSPPHEVSYTHIVVGGVVQKIPVETTLSTATELPQVRMREKSGSRRLDRRVSCKDLGRGDCEGWLYKRKEKDRKLSKNWTKRWCILKDANMYYYKSKEDLKAEGVIFLPAFQVSPAPTLKTKKFAFKVHNSGTTFYFASERQDDMGKWMNKMGLAAISFDTSQVITTGGFIKPEPRSNHLGVANIYYSESEDEADEGSMHYGSALSLSSLSSLGSAATPQPSPPVSKRRAALQVSDPGMTGAGPSPADPGEGQVAGGSLKEGQSRPSSQDLHSVMLRTIHSQALTIDGVDRRKRRTQQLSSVWGGQEGKQVTAERKLLALKRTLKMKEQEVQDIDQLLASPITSSHLRDFTTSHLDTNSRSPVV